MFWFGFIFAFIVMLAILIYYKKIKLVKKVNEVECVYRSWLTILLRVITKLSKGRNFVCIVNPFTCRMHFKDKARYLQIDIDIQLFKHEVCHINQIKREGKFKFLFSYLFMLIKYGYDNNPYEVEAREYESNS